MEQKPPPLVGLPPRSLSRRPNGRQHPMRSSATSTRVSRQPAWVPRLPLPLAAQPRGELERANVQEMMFRMYLLELARSFSVSPDMLRYVL